MSFGYSWLRWKRKCVVCDGTSITTIEEQDLCEECLGDYARLMANSDGLAEPSIVIEFLKKKTGKM